MKLWEIDGNKHATELKPTSSLSSPLTPGKSQRVLAGQVQQIKRQNVTHGKSWVCADFSHDMSHGSQYWQKHNMLLQCAD